VVGEGRAPRRRSVDGGAVGRRLRARHEASVGPASSAGRGRAERRAFRTLPGRGARRLSRRRRVQWGAVTVDLRSLAAMLGEGAVSTDPADLAAHAHDWWTLALLRQRRGDTFTLPAAVVR